MWSRYSPEQDTRCHHIALNLIHQAHRNEPQLLEGNGCFLDLDQQSWQLVITVLLHLYCCKNYSDMDHLLTIDNHLLLIHVKAAAPGHQIPFKLPLRQMPIRLPNYWHPKRKVWEPLIKTTWQENSITRMDAGDRDIQGSISPRNHVVQTARAHFWHHVMMTIFNFPSMNWSRYKPESNIDVAAYRRNKSNKSCNGWTF